MQVKFTVKGLTEEFYEGFGESIPSFNAMNPYEKYEKRRTLSRDLPRCISQKQEQFNHMTELNMLIKSGTFTCQHETSPRRGYNVHTFTFGKAQQ
jgi:hypothetical protein